MDRKGQVAGLHSFMDQHEPFRNTPGQIALVAKGQMLSPFVRQRVIPLNATPSKENLATLRELAESGTLTPIIDCTHPLSETAEAIRYIERDHARAKVVLTV